MPPIRVATIGRQRSLAGLAKAVFDTGNRPELLERAVEALRRANPHLADEGAIRPGATVFVPELTAVGPGATEARMPDNPVADFALERAEALSAVTERILDDAISQAKARAEDMRADATIKAIRKTRPDLVEHIESIQEGTAREVERLSDAAGRARATVEAVRDALRARSRHPAPPDA